jgi:hypothetical protein
MEEMSHQFVLASLSLALSVVPKVRGPHPLHIRGGGQQGRKMSCFNANFWLSLLCVRSALLKGSSTVKAKIRLGKFQATGTGIALGSCSGELHVNTRLCFGEGGEMHAQLLCVSSELVNAKHCLVLRL